MEIKRSEPARKRERRVSFSTAGQETAYRYVDVRRSHGCSFWRISVFGSTIFGSTIFC